MNIGRTILLTATALFCGSLSFAQTNVTERITNPGFEKNLDGWENNGMQAQSNNSFTLKVGNVYCEKWVSSGNKVPNVYVRQTLTDLPVGTYTLKAVAQNIQQNSTAKQKGAFIFANDDRTEVSTATSYSVQTTICDGELQLGFLTKSCTGNYVTVDDFQLTLEEPTEETEPMDPVKKVGGDGWIGLVIIAGVLTVLLAGAMIFRSVSRRGRF